MHFELRNGKSKMDLVTKGRHKHIMVSEVAGSEASHPSFLSRPEIDSIGEGKAVVVATKEAHPPLVIHGKSHPT